MCGLREKTLPASIVLLKQLVRLCGVIDVPDGIGTLTSLEELLIQGYSTRPEKFLKELGNLRELRALRFSTAEKPGMDEMMQRDFVESLRNLQKIKHIEVEGRSWKTDTAIWEAAGFVLPRPLHNLSLRAIIFSKLPSCIIDPSRLPNLSYLKLRVTRMDEQDMKLLARLPALCFLELETRSTVTISISVIDGDSYFQKLRYFNVNAMVQFQQQPNEDSSVAMHVWNGAGAMPSFGSGKSCCSKVVPSAVTPNLEVLKFEVPLRALMDDNGVCGNFGWEYLHSLREVRGTIYGFDVSAAEAALRNACQVHHNHPTLHLRRVPEVRYDENFVVSPVSVK